MEKYQFSEQERKILESLPQPLAVYQFINDHVIPLILSDGFCDLFGYEDRARAYQSMERDMYKDTHPDDIARISYDGLRFAQEDSAYDIVYRTRSKNGSDYHIVHARGKHIYTESGVRLAYVWYFDEGICTDDSSAYVSELNKSMNLALQEESLLKSSKYDYLTGLPNMTRFIEIADSSKEVLSELGEQPVLLYINLSGMKFFNSKYGFAEGNKLLQAFAKILAKNLGSENCCHISGDHFAAYTIEDGLDETLQQLFRECQEINDGKSLPIHIGIYPASVEKVPASNAFDRAKLACDSLKNNFESCFAYYDEKLNHISEQRQYILSNLDRAINEKWIQVYYQPIVRAVNGRVCDEEALARWIDPVKGMLSPGDFIPYLEDAGLIYKLDLCIVDQVLEKIRFQQESGFHIVPHSINLSRSDFEACDIVEEIRKRVDEAHISRNMISVEITESLLSSRFDFMKEQISRFQQLGFPVWMDDFGSGYSSLDVLQSIKFDLLKFDMSFMQKLDEGDNGKIILTELMKMATALGLETVCEGVETEDQVHFLQEIGCSKLQGYYFCKPIPLAQIIERYQNNIQIGYENPEESDYYEVVGRVNLYDFAVIANEDEDGFARFFNTLPMGIIEVNGEYTRFMRSNRSYREFIKRYFHLDLDFEGTDFVEYSATFMYNIVRTCCEQGTRSFYDEKMPDGTIVHSFARRIGINPVNGNIAVAIVVLSMSDPNEGATYADIARALAADFYNIYYVDMDTEKFIEYSSPVGGEELAIERHGENFFGSSQKDIRTRIYPEDRDWFLSVFTKENIIRELDSQGVFTATYRLIDKGFPMYVNMKATRMQQGSNRIIIGISIIDSQMKQKEETSLIQREESVYARIMAFAGDYLSLYTIDRESDRYIEYSASNDYKKFGFAKTGDDFFRDAIINGKKVVYAEDLPLYLSRFTKENILREIKEKGSFQIRYRLMINGEPKPVLLKIISFKENDGEKFIAGVRPWRERQ